MPAEVKQVSVAAPADLFSVSHRYLQPHWLLVTGSSVGEICAVPFIFLRHENHSLISVAFYCVRGKDSDLSRPSGRFVRACAHVYICRAHTSMWMHMCVFCHACVSA